jgi:hypothetical protein
MKAKSLAVLSTAVVLSMSVAAHSEEECNNNPWVHWNGDACVPYDVGIVHHSTVNLWHAGALGTAAGTAACALLTHRPARLCGWIKKLKAAD